jgi:hypothetical protein
MLIENLGDVGIDQESDWDEAFTHYCRRGPYDLVLTDDYHDYHQDLDVVGFVKAIRKENPLRKIILPLRRGKKTL